MLLAEVLVVVVCAPRGCRKHFGIPSVDLVKNPWSRTKLILEAQ